MQLTKNDGIESEVYDEFLAIDLTDQKEFEEYNNSDANITKRRRLKDSVSTYGLSSIAACSALLSQVIDII
jgi:hypothetical protein